ncbi:hypothetical protein [Schleiferilactobacillus perolens]|uniref:Surface layer protein A domain-containing protein n=1 Tax=Schleiferilactobacillus perolens DSM 12744 TaxID=1423792 RepID=A0A0R1MX19_9LACO|nr:hypothetical protein [Schleiferilactobacillus perolens]KRL12561.1 hypothetical protein FD09_GL002880 [Schleiferilactobacillus perolens DSM 12744]
MKISKVLASMLLLLGVSAASQVIAQNSVPVQAATVSEPAVINLHGDRAILYAWHNDGMKYAPMLRSLWGGSWRVTAVRIDAQTGDIYFRVATDVWMKYYYYNTRPTLNKTLVQQMQNTAQQYSKSQGNIGGFVNNGDIDYKIAIVKTLAKTPIVAQPGSTKVIRTLPEGTRWRITQQSYRLLLSATDNSPIYYQVANHQWVDAKYVAQEIKAYRIPVLSLEQGLQAYRFDNAKLKMIPTRWLAPRQNWGIDYRYSPRINYTFKGSYYFQIGANEWVTGEGGQVGN